MAYTNDSIWKSVDWMTICIYLMLVIFGWFSVCGASYDYGEIDFFSFDTRAGKQFVLICCSLGHGIILNMLDDIPPLSVMLTIIQAAMEPWEHGMSYTKVQNLYDYWADKEGGNQTDLYSKVIIPTLAVSGFFTQEQADVLVEEMQNV